MKNFIKLLGITVLIAINAQNASAQFKFSAGADIGMVTNEGSGLSYGLSVGGEYLVGENMGLTLQSGYSIVSNDYSGISSSLMPYMAGFKYYFTNNEGGLYGHAQVGLASFKVGSISSTNLSFAPGLGYLLNEHIDLGFRYQIVTANEGADAINWIALRAAYQF